MALKKGDKVRFLNEVGSGVVTRWIDQQMVMVLTEDDFEIPILANELVKIDQYENTLLKEEHTSNNEDSYLDEEEDIWEDSSESSIVQIEGNDVFLAYLALKPSKPDQVAKSDFSLHFINDSNFQLFVVLMELEEGKAITIFNELVESNTKVKIKNYFNSDLNRFPQLKAQVLAFAYGKFEAQQPIDKTISIKPQRFYKQGSFIENDYFEEQVLMVNLSEPDLMDAFSNHLDDKEVEKMMHQKKLQDHSLDQLSQKFKVSSTNPLKEVDLHIHELIDNPKGLSNGEMLNIQMETFHRELNAGLKDHQIKKMVFIHGVGAGTLKQEIRKALSGEYPQLYFQDASFKEYGFGATMVILRRG
ncbi:MAG: DUF2027 domain-containing protein [Bacteroidales bacterium]|nr:DUF2027 domain-containing protein [Bacteroidales bacterium]